MACVLLLHSPSQKDRYASVQRHPQSPKQINEHLSLEEGEEEVAIQKNHNISRCTQEGGKINRVRSTHDGHSPPRLFFFFMRLAKSSIDSKIWLVGFCQRRFCFFFNILPFVPCSVPTLFDRVFTFIVYKA